MMIAAVLAGQETPADDAAAWGLDLYMQRPRPSVSQRMERDCADGVRPAEESQAACRERVSEAAIQEALARGNATRRAPGWTQENEREWTAGARRGPIDRLRDCRQFSERGRDGESSAWSIRCGDQDGPAAQALDRVLNQD